MNSLFGYLYTQIFLPLDSAGSLGVVTWIPRRVKDDDAIVANQIHPQTPDFGGHEEW